MVSRDDLVSGTPLVSKNGDHTSPMSVERMEVYVEHAILKYAKDKIPFASLDAMALAPVEAPRHRKFAETMSEFIESRVLALKRDLISLASDCIERAFSIVSDHVQRNATELRVIKYVDACANKQVNLFCAMTEESFVH